MRVVGVWTYFKDAWNSTDLLLVIAYFLYFTSRLLELRRYDDLESIRNFEVF